MRLLILTTREGGLGQSEAPQDRNSEGLAHHWVWRAAEAGYFKRSEGQNGDRRNCLEGAHREHTGGLGPLPSDYINPGAGANLHNHSVSLQFPKPLPQVHRPPARTHACEAPASGGEAPASGGRHRPVPERLSQRLTSRLSRGEAWQ